MKSAEVRQKFLEFYQNRGHEIVASSPLVPGNDPTLLFTNAGMVQFKDLFLGKEKRSYVRAVSSQRCVRAGGKHNDLENVGYTARHHTFFEMLGNFSFGDYFKREAIASAWEFVTQELGLPADRLWVTVFKDDDEAADIWIKEIGVDPGRLSRLGEKDNFWAMGDTGPCGPCSEIFYDHGPEVAGGPPGTPEEDGDRYVEIWNLVFMQFDRSEDGTLTPLPRPSVDTGMGLERISAVMQGVHSNYQIDLFAKLIGATADIIGVKQRDLPSLYVIADHIRACSFLIVDGVLPSNEGRGYVLRRIIRRAIRHGYKLGMSDPFFHLLVAPLVAEMGEAYPELAAQADHVRKILLQEEERFAETLDQGMRILEESIAGMRGSVIPGRTVFKLYDTYGFPIDLTEDIARERQLTLDHAGFKQEMEAQRTRARASSMFGSVGTASDARLVADLPATEFTGYENLEGQAKVVALICEGKAVESLEPGQTGQVLLDATPFYAESGGQVGDTGELAGATSHFKVMDSQKLGNTVSHIGELSGGAITLGETLTATVDAERRQAIVLNHSATHLLHAALRQVLGEHVNQKGSRVAPERLRFDFSHYEAVTSEQLRQVEDLVNEQVRGNGEARTAVMGYDEAIEAGAMALFGEKYGEHVRVLKIGDFSTELCGGTHVAQAGDIGLMRIVSESGVAAGVRRIEALSGKAALDWIRAQDDQLGELADMVKGPKEDLGDKVRQLLQRNRSLEKELEKLKSQLAGGRSTDLADQAVDVKGVKVVAARLEGADRKTLRTAMDQLKDRLGSAVVVLAAVTGPEELALIAGVTKDRMGQVKAGDLINAVAQQVGGRGGGRPDMAQAGGSDVAKLDEALASVVAWVEERLG
jgi:alanyl-tRNA synthetase